MNFNKVVCRRESFCHVVSNNLGNGPWTALTAYPNFSSETLDYNQDCKEVF